MIQFGASRGSTERRVQEQNMEKHGCGCVLVSWLCVSACVRDRERLKESRKTHIGSFNLKVTENGIE